MQSILESIIEIRRKDLAAQKLEVSPEVMEEKARSMKGPKINFLKTINRPSPNGMHIIAEIKKASPSKGIICEDFQPRAIAESYHSAGASALSVLTEERFFLGRDSYLRDIAASVSLPCLRKDFIFDPYQVSQAKVLGSSAFLLIVDCLVPDQLQDLIWLGEQLGLTALVEVHRAPEIRTAIDCGARIIGINNRDLRTFRTTLQTTVELRSEIPGEIPVVSESGISNPEDLMLLSEHGIQAVLIGEEFMSEPQKIKRKFRRLLSFRN